MNEIIAKESRETQHSLWLSMGPCTNPGMPITLQEAVLVCVLLWSHLIIYNHLSPNNDISRRMANKTLFLDSLVQPSFLDSGLTATCYPKKSTALSIWHRLIIFLCINHQGKYLLIAVDLKRMPVGYKQLFYQHS